MVKDVGFCFQMYLTFVVKYIFMLTLNLTSKLNYGGQCASFLRYGAFIYLFTLKMRFEHKLFLSVFLNYENLEGIKKN